MADYHTCVLCAKACHSTSNRYCADHLIAFLRRNLETEMNRTKSGAGIPLRDWFAGKALVSMARNIGPGPVDMAWFEQYGASNAYQMADAMLKAREADHG